MPPTPKTASCFWFVVFAFVFTLQVVPRIFNESPVNDEPIELTNGFYYWKGDVVTHNYHPPLAKMLQALPLWTLHLKEFASPGGQNPQLKAYDFFFSLNKDRFELMTTLGRFVSLLFGLGLGFLLFLQTRRSSPTIWGSTLVLWAFEPTILAYSGLCLADLPAAFFFFASVLAFKKRWERPGLKWSLIAGVLAGMAVCCKFSCLVLLPLFVLLEGLEYFRLNKNSRTSFILRKLGKEWLSGSAAFLLFIFFLYLPGTLTQPDHLLPFSYFWHGLSNMMGYSQYHHPTYFLGQASRGNHWLYFPLAFGLKSTVPFLFLTLLALGRFLGGNQVFPSWLWISPVFFFLCVIPVQNLGVRYLLPAYPFFILMAAQVAGLGWEGKSVWGKKAGKWIVGGLLFWHAASVLASAPNMISYFNEFVPTEKKIYYLGDSDLDMGQDVKRLAEAARQKGWKNVKLAQFGGALDPSTYGLTWLPWTQKDLAGPQPGFVYAVNLSLFQLGPVFWSDLIPIAQGWASTNPPAGRVGDTWIYFEIPGEPRPDSSSALSSVRIF